MDIALNNVMIPDFNELGLFSGSIGITGNRIETISDEPLSAETVIDGKGRCVSPGLIDCHCHIESSFLTPLHFGNTVSRLGTLHVVADCHEISNVAGRNGLDFFMENSRNSMCDILFAVPSCVPATPFATSGGRLDLDDILYFLKKNRVVALGELMNVPGVIGRDPHFMEMIKAAKRMGKRVNGHAPGLHEEALAAYVGAGVDDDHESESYEELAEKIAAGLHVFIREGSAEHSDINAYRILLQEPDRVSFCTDDKSINDILDSGHINYHLRKAVQAGVPVATALRAASFTGLKYYGLDEYSELKPGSRASIVMFRDTEYFEPVLVISEGRIVESLYPESRVPALLQDSFRVKPIEPSSLPDISKDHAHIAIGIDNGSLITRRVNVMPHTQEPDVDRDLLKLVVIERYGHGYASACLIQGFGLRRGALASSVAHDCHNIIAVGVDSRAISEAVNTVIENHGGLAVHDGSHSFSLSLRVGGIVSDAKPETLADKLRMMRDQAHRLGSTLTDPFAALSFMALEVIPHLKLTDRGLFDVDTFQYV
jgi:adenine deaminase